MRKQLIFIIISMLVGMIAGHSQTNPSRFVDPFIGTENGGNVFLGAAVPFGMVKLGPDCGNNDNNSGYYRDQNINGFSHTHVSGTGGGAKYGNILVVPESGDLLISQYSSPRTDEIASAGYYTALLSRYKVKAELTSTARVGFHRYTFQEGQARHILIDAGHFLEFGKDWVECQEFVGSEVRILSNHEIEGYSRIRGGWNKGGAYTVYFYAVFDQEATETGTWKNAKLQKGIQVQADSGEKTGAFLTFDQSSGKTVQVKVGISFLSVGKAKLNVDTEIPGWNFDSVRSQAEKMWNSELEKVKVEGGSDEYKKMLYTALYHSMLMPTNKTGENPLWKSDEPYYDDLYAIWDTYRTTHPLLTLISPEIQRDMVRSMIDIYRYEGYMPDARSGNVTGRTQGGSNSDIIIADAFVKGLKGIDYETAFQAMIKNAEVPPGGNEQKEGRGGIPDYNSLGYVSTDYERAGTRTVEYSACDFAIATVAKGLGKDDLYEKYLKRSSNWKNLWRPVESYGSKGFIWPRKKDGSWEENFNVLQPGSWSDFFYESQSWELSLYVPHDVAGLIEMCGGTKAFESRLDTFFIKSNPNKNGWMDFYNINNEPGFMTPLLYNYIGKPEKSNERTRQILDKYFSATRGGLPGNDDSGAMSSWLAFQLMGFYPVAGQDLYLIAAPHFSKTILQLGNGKTLEISASNLSETNTYVQSAKLNGKPLDQAWFRHTDIKDGGKLELGMGNKPSDCFVGQEPVSPEKNIIFNIPGYPLVFEINENESFTINRTYQNTNYKGTIGLKSVRLYTEPNTWVPDSLGECDYYKAEVELSVSRKPLTLIYQPYQMPVSFNGWRIYVEAIKEMDEIPNIHPINKMRKSVRLSVCLENEPWGIPEEIEFPIENYRWRSSVYNNTWAALVPFNLLYYHRGEDLGAIPDRLEVHSWTDGIVIRSPLPEGNIGSNTISVKNANGLEFDLAHCNIEFMDSTLLLGKQVNKGQYMAKTGMTWNGKKTQYYDPHLHNSLGYKGTQLSLYPYMVEAYFRKYDDAVLAIAGGYRFANAGDSIELEASRSICRDKQNIKSYLWKLHDGNIVNQPKVKVKYDHPGLYSEELLVTTLSGKTDKDFLQVRINDPNAGKDIAFGWAYYFPVRGIKPNQPVIFWNRLTNTKSEVLIDFGDGSMPLPIVEECQHAFKYSGNYTVSLYSTGPKGEPVTVKLEVIVE